MDDLHEVVDQMVDTLIWRSSWATDRTYADRRKALDSLVALAPLCGPEHLERDIIPHFVALACDPRQPLAEKPEDNQYDWCGIRQSAVNGLARLYNETTAYVTAHRPDLAEPLKAWWELQENPEATRDLLFRDDPRVSVIAAFGLADSPRDEDRDMLVDAYERVRHADVKWGIVNALSGGEASWVQRKVVHPWIRRIARHDGACDDLRAAHACYLIQKSSLATPEARAFLATVPAHGLAVAAGPRPARLRQAPRCGDRAMAPALVRADRLRHGRSHRSRQDADDRGRSLPSRRCTGPRSKRCATSATPPRSMSCGAPAAGTRATTSCANSVFRWRKRCIGVSPAASTVKRFRRKRRKHSVATVLSGPTPTRGLTARALSGHARRCHHAIPEDSGPRHRVRADPLRRSTAGNAPTIRKAASSAARCSRSVGADATVARLSLQPRMEGRHARPRSTSTTAGSARCGSSRPIARRWGRQFRPMFIGLHWPSLPWGEESFGAAAVVVRRPPARRRLTPLLEAAVAHFGGGDAVRASARSDLPRLRTRAGRSRAAGRGRRGLRAAGAAIGFSAGEGGDAPPDQDGAPLDPQAAIRAERMASAGEAFGIFGTIKNGVLAGLRQASFWLMKHRARTVGEQGMHTFVVGSAARVRCQRPPHGPQLRLHRRLVDPGRAGRQRARSRAR